MLSFNQQEQMSWAKEDFHFKQLVSKEFVVVQNTKCLKASIVCVGGPNLYWSYLIGSKVTRDGPVIRK